MGVHSGSIDINHLNIVFSLDAQNLMTCCLRFTRGNGQLLAQNTIQQGGLAHIGPSNNGHKTGLDTHDSSPSFRPKAIRTCSAAACSAARRLLPSERVTGLSEIVQVTVKTCLL